MMSDLARSYDEMCACDHSIDWHRGDGGCDLCSCTAFDLVRAETADEDEVRYWPASRWNKVLRCELSAGDLVTIERALTYVITQVPSGTVSFDNAVVARASVRAILKSAGVPYALPAGERVPRAQAAPLLERHS